MAVAAGSLASLALIVAAGSANFRIGRVLKPLNEFYGKWKNNGRVLVTGDEVERTEIA